MSGYFKRHQPRYYDTLLGVSMSGAWHEWFAFLLDAVVDQARETAVLAERLLRLRESHLEMIRSDSLQGRLLTLVDGLFRWPVVTARSVAQKLGVTDPTARKDIKTLVERGVLVATPEMAWGQTWYARQILDIVDHGAPADDR